MMRSWIRGGALALALGLATGLTGCAIHAPSERGRVTASYGAFGLDLEARDVTIRPGDDFWGYANGDWARRTPLGSGVEAAGVGVDLSKRADANVEAMFEALAEDQEPAIPNGAILGDLYASWKDEAAIEAQGLRPAAPDLARIAAAQTPNDLKPLLADPGLPGPILFGVSPDPDDPGLNLVIVAPGALGMPEDYFLQEGSAYDGYRVAYLAYVERLLALAGSKDAAGEAAAVVALETRIAKSRAVSAGVGSGQLAKRDLARLVDAAPGLDWSRMLEAAGFPSSGDILLQNPEQLTSLAGMIDDTTLAIWRSYLTFRFLSANAPFLPHAFADAHSAFHRGALGGGRVAPTRSQAGVVLAEDRLGDAVGSAYAERYLSAGAVAQVHEIIEDVREAYRRRILASTWLDDATRAGALEKIGALRAEVGAPQAPDYSGLRLDRSDLFGNIQRIAAFQRDRDRRSLDTRRTGAEWPIVRPGPQGNYFPQANSIRLQAALLQPPYFDPAADAAVNYGAIGAFIGHEIGHALDSQGSRYDAEGRERDWWTPASRAEFERRVAALDGQYAGYEAAPGVPLNTMRTSGENIADLAGAEAANIALGIRLRRDGGGRRIGGLTADQRFFLANAQMRRTMVQDDVARQLAAVGVHAPSRHRVNGVLRNMDAWYEAFGVSTDEALYLAPEARVRIW